MVCLLSRSLPVQLQGIGQLTRVGRLPRRSEPGADAGQGLFSGFATAVGVGATDWLPPWRQPGLDLVLGGPTGVAIDHQAAKSAMNPAMRS